MIVYYTHRNGGRPYKVCIYEETISVYRFCRDEDGEETESPLLLSFENKDYFVGKSFQNAMTSFSGGFGESFDGNTILIETDPFNYTYIGGNGIISFTSLGDIVEYHSPVGNNDVPYPYAIDVYRNYYLIEEKVILKRIHNPDPYDSYYSSHIITRDEGIIPSREPMISAFKGIVEYFINEEKYTLSYSPFSGTVFDRLTSEGEKMFVTTVDGDREELTKNKYISLMSEFGEQQGFLPLEHSIVDRI